MSPTAPALDLLHRVADEVQLAFSERHHKIATAIASDMAFQADRRPLSALVRSLVLDGVRLGASRVGLGIETMAGGGVELLRQEGVTIDHFRVRAATRDEDGDIQIIVNGDPTAHLASGEIDEQGSFLMDEHWVFGFMYDDEGFITELFTARVLGVTETKVHKLLLGPAVPLGSAGATPPPEGFRPADEDDLDGFEDDAEDDESGSASA